MLQFLFLNYQLNGRGASLNQKVVDVIRPFNRRFAFERYRPVLENFGWLSGGHKRMMGGLHIPRAQQKPSPAISLKFINRYLLEQVPLVKNSYSMSQT